MKKVLLLSLVLFSLVGCGRVEEKTDGVIVPPTLPSILEKEYKAQQHNVSTSVSFSDKYLIGCLFGGDNSYGTYYDTVDMYYAIRTDKIIEIYEPFDLENQGCLDSNYLVAELER